MPVNSNLNAYTGESPAPGIYKDFSSNIQTLLKFICKKRNIPNSFHPDRMHEEGFVHKIFNLSGCNY